jgi:hypothetical protein
MIRNYLVAVFLAAIAPQAFGAPIIFDLATDWSDTQNPNGVWTYTGNNSAVLATNQADWDTSSVVFGSPQKAWANSTFFAAGHVPMWFKRTSDSTQLDIAVGGVGMHGTQAATPAFVGASWTSTTDGTVDIAGGVWQALKVTEDGVGGNHQSRNSDWRITLNGLELTGGNVSGMDAFTSLSPFDLLSGSGGATALSNLAISVNDVITLEFISPSSFSTFNGVDLTISLEADAAIPEPGALGLLGVGLLGLVFVRRRRGA